MFTLRMQWLRKFQETTRSSSLPCWGSKIEVIDLVKAYIYIVIMGFGYVGFFLVVWFG